MQLQNMRLKEDEWSIMQTALESELSKALDKAEAGEIAFMELLAAREAGEAYLVGGEVAEISLSPVFWPSPPISIHTWISAVPLC